MPVLLIPILVIGALNIAVKIAEVAIIKYAEYEADKYINKLKAEDLKNLEEDTETP